MFWYARMIAGDVELCFPRVEIHNIEHENTQVHIYMSRDDPRGMVQYTQP